MHNKRIGIMIPEISDPLDYELLDGAHLQAKALGCDLIVYTGVYNAQSEFQNDCNTEGLENIYSLVKFQQLDGIIFVQERFHKQEMIDQIYKHLQQTDIPCVVIGDASDGFPSVEIQQKQEVYCITNHLINVHQCKKLYCIAGVPDHPASEERLQGFRNAMQEASLAMDGNTIHYGYYWKDIPSRMKSLLQGLIRRSTCCPTQISECVRLRSIAVITANTTLCGSSGREPE